MPRSMPIKASPCPLRLPSSRSLKKEIIPDIKQIGTVRIGMIKMPHIPEAKQITANVSVLLERNERVADPELYPPGE